MAKDSKIKEAFNKVVGVPSSIKEMVTRPTEFTEYFNPTSSKEFSFKVKPGSNPASDILTKAGEIFDKKLPMISKRTGERTNDLKTLGNGLELVEGYLTENYNLRNLREVQFNAHHIIMRDKDGAATDIAFHGDKVIIAPIDDSIQAMATTKSFVKSGKAENSHFFLQTLNGNHPELPGFEGYLVQENEYSLEKTKDGTVFNFETDAIVYDSNLSEVGTYQVLNSDPTTTNKCSIVTKGVPGEKFEDHCGETCIELMTKIQNGAVLNASQQQSNTVEETVVDNSNIVEFPSQE